MQSWQHGSVTHRDEGFRDPTAKVRDSACQGAFSRHAFVLSFEPCWREPHSLVRECPNLAGEHEPSYMILTARTLEHVLLVTRNHHGFVLRRLDQVHLTAARKTPHVDRPFTFNSER